MFTNLMKKNKIINYDCILKTKKNIQNPCKSHENMTDMQPINFPTKDMGDGMAHTKIMAHTYVHLRYTTLS